MSELNIEKEIKSFIKTIEDLNYFFFNSIINLINNHVNLRLLIIVLYLV
jgi:hypothetical protein